VESTYWLEGQFPITSGQRSSDQRGCSSYSHVLHERAFASGFSVQGVKWPYAAILVGTQGEYIENFMDELGKNGNV
jgi:hypothetical protein